MDLEIRKVIIHESFRPRYSVRGLIFISKLYIIIVIESICLLKNKVNDVALLQLTKALNIPNLATWEKINYVRYLPFESHITVLAMVKLSFRWLDGGPPNRPIVLIKYLLGLEYALGSLLLCAGPIFH